MKNSRVHISLRNRASLKKNPQKQETVWSLRNDFTWHNQFIIWSASNLFSNIKVWPERNTWTKDYKNNSSSRIPWMATVGGGGRPADQLWHRHSQQGDTYLPFVMIQVTTGGRGSMFEKEKQTIPFGIMSTRTGTCQILILPLILLTHIPCMPLSCHNWITSYKAAERSAWSSFSTLRDVQNGGGGGGGVTANIFYFAFNVQCHYLVVFCWCNVQAVSCRSEKSKCRTYLQGR